MGTNKEVSSNDEIDVSNAKAEPQDSSIGGTVKLPTMNETRYQVSSHIMDDIVKVLTNDYGLSFRSIRTVFRPSIYSEIYVRGLDMDDARMIGTCIRYLESPKKSSVN